MDPKEAVIEAIIEVVGVSHQLIGIGFAYIFFQSQNQQQYRMRCKIGPEKKVSEVKIQLGWKMDLCGEDLI
jgi:hypothetical protein